MISFGGLLSLIFLMLVRDVLFPGGVKTVVRTVLLSMWLHGVAIAWSQRRKHPSMQFCACSSSQCMAGAYSKPN